jgi:Fe-Mn family superoxide dismutase
MNNHYPFEPPPLRYSYHALEPYINAQTVTLHYEKHFKSYVDNLNRALEHYPAYQAWPLERLIRQNCRLPFQIQTSVWHNAGGVFNHGMYFNILGKPVSDNNAAWESGSFLHAAAASYGSGKAFFNRLKECAMAQFGSGWAWVVSDRRGKIRIMNTPNQDTPITCGFCPVIALDVWEHAYYLQYQNRREEYVDAFFHVLDPHAVEQNYLACTSPRLSHHAAPQGKSNS